MKNISPSIIVVASLGFVAGIGLSLLIGIGRPDQVPAVPNNPISPLQSPVPEVAQPAISPAPTQPLIAVGWRIAADEIRTFSGDTSTFDAALASRLAAFPDNPTATLALLFAAAEWADRVGDSTCVARKEAASNAFTHYWSRSILWRMEEWQFSADLYKLAEKTDNQTKEEFCLRQLKRTFEECYHGYQGLWDSSEERERCVQYYENALDRLANDGRTIDILDNLDVRHGGRNVRRLSPADNILLSEMLRSSDSVFNVLLDNSYWSIRDITPPTAEELATIEAARLILIKLLDKEAASNAAFRATMFPEDHEPSPNQRTQGGGKVMNWDEFLKAHENVPPFDPEKANKEYHDLTSDPPLPKPGEKGPPKPPEEKLVPYLKDPTNKDPKANGLGLSLETLTDVTRADLGPLPFPLPLRLTGLEGARNPVPPPPGMISDRAKTQLTYKPRRALINYLQKQAGRDIPNNYGKVDAPLLYWASLEEYMAHKDNKPEVCFLIGRNLEHAQRLLLADPIQIRRSGVGLAEVATMFLQTNMDDKPLAMAIMDLYVMPYLHLGDKRRENHLSKANLLVTAMGVYSWSDFPDKLQLAAEEATRESGDQNSQDAGRFAIAKALVRQQKFDEAIVVLGQITDPSLVDGAKSYAESLRKKHGESPKP